MLQPVDVKGRRRTRSLAPALLLTAMMLGFDWPLFGRDPLTSNIHSDEEILFFPEIGWSTPQGKWHLPIQGCVLEPEPRKLALAALRKALQLRHVDVSPAEEAVLAERARLFMVDHERRKRVVVQVGEQRFSLEKSGPDGWFRGELILSAEQAGTLLKPASSGPPAISFQACLPDGDTRVFTGKVMLVPPEGIMVVSDIDDTIKVSHVLERAALLRSTFLEPFAAVSGMPELYRTWAAGGDCHFCYVSGSPWPLFLPLSQFVASTGFPEGTFHLRQVRWAERSALDFFKGPEKHKFAVIEPLFEKFPNKRFVLVGDSGEMDPEIYGAIARKHKAQIARIFIREVHPWPEEKRYESAFRGLERSLWTTFSVPSSLEEMPGAKGSGLKSAADGAN